MIKKLFARLLLLLSCSLNGGKEKKERINLYALYTPSHEQLLNDWFLPSIKDPYNVILRFFDVQDGEGLFAQEDWFRAVLAKVDFIIFAIQENRGKIFIFSDVDIAFYGRSWSCIRRAMRDKDMVFQKDNPTGSVCTGFFACRGSKKTLAFWQKVRRLMEKYKNSWHDQTAANYLLRTSNSHHTISWGYLPDSFFGGGTLSGKRWNPGDSLLVPKNPIMHHANYTAGVDHKIAQLGHVKNIMREKK